MHQILLITSAIPPVSAIAQFYLYLIYCNSRLLESATSSTTIALLLARLSYQLHISGLSISVVIVSVTPISYFCHLSTRGNSTICTCVKSLITFWYQLHLSLTEICFQSKILVSGIPISYSFVTAKFPYSQSLPYQLLLSSITAFLLHSSCSDYSLQVLVSAIFVTFSFLLLSVTLIIYS